jgi:heat-inducible transcriptional repressor
MKKLEEALEETSEVISLITHYTGIVSFLEWQDKFFYKGISYVLDQPEFRDLDKIRILIKMIEDKERLLNIINRDFSEKVKVYIGSELDYPGMENCSLVVSSFRRKEQPLGRLAVLGPVRMEYKHIIPTLEYVSDALTDMMENI